ncbi:hypothetical protein SBRCBS47491_000402 [Sporothrix bragantina]|uniref:Anaphase-promoting complex, subunit 15/MND2 n=1 Tax=Sporothrix bragantina TaxID=671064 RepID=A0ABP0AQ42_9PEZI
MGSFVLDFSAYNALLSSNGHGTSYYGADDAYLGGGDPGLSVAPGRRPGHLHHHLNQQHHQQQQQQQQQQHGLGQNAYPRHQISNRYIVHDRNSLARLEAEKTYQDRRKQHIANFGSTWLKPPGVPKTLFQIREECREQEEQAEAERREELAQQLAQAEAAALEGADGTALEEGGVGAELTGEPGGATDLMGDGDADAVAAGMDADMMDEDDEQDLDNDIPDADAEDFSFGNNDDEDDPFASSSEDEDEDEDDEDDEDEDDEADAGNNDEQPDALDANVTGDGSILAGAGDDAEGTHGLHYTHDTPDRRQQVRQDVYVSTPATAAAGQSSAVAGATATPVRSIEEQRAQARARAAERREMRQMRAAEDRMRALRAHPRLSGVGMAMGMGLGMGLYGDDEDLDEEDQAQMLQEDDLVRETSSPNISSSHQQQQQGREQIHHRHRHTNDNDNNIARGNLRGGANNNSSSFIDDHIHQDDESGFENEGDGESGLEMDMDADLDDDGGLGGAMDLSAFGDGTADMDDDGGYEHTDTEAELSSSVAGGDDDNDGGHHLSHHSFLPLAGAASGSSSMAAPRSSGIGIGSLGHSHGHGPAHGRLSGVGASGGRHRQQFRGSLARSDRNSMDISSLLSQDGSSAFGSSPQMHRL